MKIFYILLLVFLSVIHLYAQIEDPVIPVLETEKFQSTTEKKYTVKSFIEFAGGLKKDGIIHFPSNKISIKYSSRKEQTSEDLSRIVSIEFLKWKGTPISKNSIRFNPSSVRIVFDDQSIFESGGNIPSLNEFTVEKSGRKEKVYGYFFDYWKNGKWVNSKSNDKDYPQTNPMHGTVMKITFKKETQEFDLNKILPKLLRKVSP
jgi:hypothetical protein